jgi:hypothetical protein
MTLTDSWLRVERCSECGVQRVVLYRSNALLFDAEGRLQMGRGRCCRASKFHHKYQLVRRVETAEFIAGVSALFGFGGPPDAADDSST